MAPLRLSFLIRSTYDLLSSKNNVFKWKKESDPTFPLCDDKPQSLDHVLSSCKKALGNGRYTWRYNRVLEELVKFIKSYMKSEATISTQKFVSERVSKQAIKHRAVPGQNLCSSHRSISFRESMPPPRDSVTHCSVNRQSALILSSSQELFFSSPFFYYLFRNSEGANVTSGHQFSVSGNVNFSNAINYLAKQMNNETSFKQHNKERFIIVAGVKE